MTVYPTISIATTPVGLPIGSLGEPPDVVIPIARHRWLVFVATLVLGSVGLAAAGIFLSFLFDIPSLLGVSGFLLFFAGVVALAARDKLRRHDVVGECDGKNLARIVPRPD